MLAQAVDGLNVYADGIYVDGTFGRGGHSRRILQLLGSGGTLIALDRDPDAIQAGAALHDKRLTLLHGRFGELQVLLESVFTAPAAVELSLPTSAVMTSRCSAAHSSTTCRPWSRSSTST